MPLVRSKLLRRALLAACIIGVSLVTLLAFALCQGPPTYYREKYAPIPTSLAPSRMPATFIPEVQTESHTCGFHAASTVYKAFGLDPGTLKLRFRLGTDALANNFDPASLGTLHPDLLRVLQQDGFNTQLFLSLDDDAIAQIIAHLDAGYPAIILTQPKGLHWTVLAPANPGSCLVVDSLQPQTSTVVTATYLKQHVIHAICIRPH